MKHLIAVLLATIILGGCSFGGGGAPLVRVDFERTTSFEDNELIIHTTQFDGTRVRLSTLRDAESTGPFVTEMPGHEGRAWTLLQMQEGGENTFLGYAVVSWNKEDPGDYLAAGWWMHFANQRYPDIDPYHDDTEIYAFIDGPEIDPKNPPSLPAMGTASYSGGAGGRFLYLYGANWPEDVQDKVSTEEITGMMTLTADFAAGTLEGCWGCVGDLTVQRMHLVSAFDRIEEEPVELLMSPKDYNVHFAPTKFSLEGIFDTREGVTVTHPERSIEQIRFGYLAGSFSNRQDSAGNPRLVNGFGGALFVEEDGSASIISMIFNALSEDFRASAQNQGR
ncbi:MAG: hypothetical protein OXG62_06370 [Nitrospinae bacterium]|nr:hypothetical protein [Nitrospinota bacterium]